MNGYLILTYINNETVVIHDDLRFDTNLKPELSFAFDALYFEPPNGHCLKVVDGESVPLSEAEIEECAAYCRGYADTADYPVYAWNGDNVCVGRILKSEAEAKGYGFTVLDVPPYPVSRRNGEAWEEIVAIIRDDGSLVERPEAFCEKCVLFLSHEEWEAFPERPTPAHVYDLENSEWVDPRPFAKLLHEVQLEIRNCFEIRRWKVWGKFIPQYEQLTWPYQVEEAKGFLKDNAFATPYIDAFLAARTDEGKPDKESLCKDILVNHTAYLRGMAAVNAEQWGWLKRTETSAVNGELDAISKEVAELQRTFLGK